MELRPGWAFLLRTFNHIRVNKKWKRLNHTRAHTFEHGYFLARKFLVLGPTSSQVSNVCALVWFGRLRLRLYNKNMKKHQVVVIHGGSAYNSYEDFLSDLKASEVSRDELGRTPSDGWNDTLGKKLGTDYDVMLPEMPNWMNAKYIEWKIWFDKFGKFFEDDIVMIGHSLGGIFLAKYLSENLFPKKIKAVFLLAAPYDLGGDSDSLGDFALPKDLSKITDQCKNVFIYHSKDDPVVKFKGNYDEYIAALPEATGVVFENKNHFRLKEFPELEEAIQEFFR